MASSSSSSCYWLYDVFPSFSGKDVRQTFISHFLKEFDLKSIITFKDNEIESGRSLDPDLKQAIRTSKIAVVVLSKRYSSSSWCLEELMEIVKCKKEVGQIVIPIFYGLDPSHVRYQTGKFGEAFDKICLRKTKEQTTLWRLSLTDVANIKGYHSHKWPSEANMIEAIANDVLRKLNITPPKDFERVISGMKDNIAEMSVFKDLESEEVRKNKKARTFIDDSEDFVGMENHIAKMHLLLDLESEEVRMIGIWGTSIIDKTTIARALYSRLSDHFQGSVFMDKAFVSRSTEIYKIFNLDDYNKKLNLLRSCLSEVLGKKDIRIDSLNAMEGMEGMLKNKKLLIFIDDLDDQMLLDTLVDQTHWLGRGSRIIVVSKDIQFLMAHGVDSIYEVSLPSTKLSQEMFCISAF